MILTSRRSLSILKMRAGHFHCVANRRLAISEKLGSKKEICPDGCSISKLNARIFLARLAFCQTFPCCDKNHDFHAPSTRFRYAQNARVFCPWSTSHKLLHSLSSVLCEILSPSKDRRVHLLYVTMSPMHEILHDGGIWTPLLWLQKSKQNLS